MISSMLVADVVTYTSLCQFFLAFFKTMCYTRMCSHKNEMYVFIAELYADFVKNLQAQSAPTDFCLGCVHILLENSHKHFLNIQQFINQI